MGKLPENTLILTSEPFVGFMPSDLRVWLTDHNSDIDLACALAEVNDHVGLLGHELDEVEDRWLLYAYEVWWEVELELYDLIFDSMKRSNQRGETKYNLTQEGLYYRVKPFMERNGYQDGSGWWVKLEEELR
jgi:hypothetical protein